MKFPAFAAFLMLTGCATGSLPKSYVLSPPADPVAGVRSEDGRSVVEVPTVALPDYLDTSDILRRDGRNELTASTTGHWGERLSVGITYALIVSLTRRLPSVLVVHGAVSGQSAREVLVNIEAFDIRQDGRCVLTARWSIVGDDHRTVQATERGTFVTTAAGQADDAIVAAMADAVGQLADRLAVTLNRRGPR